VKTEKLGAVAGGEGECGDVAGWLVRQRRSLDILPVKKEAKLSASEMPGEVVGRGEEHLRCRSLLTVCCFLLRRYNTCVVYNRGIHREDTWRSGGQRRLSTTTIPERIGILGAADFNQ